jgi:hypothetical protein
MAAASILPSAVMSAVIPSLQACRIALVPALSATSGREQVQQIAFLLDDLIGAD